MNVKKRLFEMQEEKYRYFVAKLIPNVSPDAILGVRTPNIRKLAKELIKKGNYANFIKSLPHTCIEEYQLHSFIICEIKDFDACIAEVKKLLPYIDNWGVCDSLRPKCFAKNKDALIPYIEKWIKSNHTYTARFAIEMLMVHYLEGDFLPIYPQLVANVNGESYYLKMMVAWYFATALAKQYDDIIPYFENGVISDRWTHNKAIQKAIESYRISDEQKRYLKTLKK